MHISAMDWIGLQLAGRAGHLANISWNESISAMIVKPNVDPLVPSDISSVFQHFLLQGWHMAIDVLARVYS